MRTTEFITEVIRTMKNAARNVGGRDFLRPWIELIQKSQEIELSPEAKKLLYRVKYDGRYDDLSLENDLTNERKPNSKHYGSANKLIDFMRRNKYTDTMALKNGLKAKWEKIEDEQL